MSIYQYEDPEKMVYSLIRNYPKIINFTGEILDRSELKWVNSLTCSFHSRALLPILKQTLPVQDIFIRRSVLTPKDFNLVFSDLDLGFVVDENADLSEIKLAYNRVRKVLPFLGETEIYTQDELKELEQLLWDSNTYNFFRDLRKVRWMEKKYASTENGYDKKKCLRAIQKSLIRIGSNREATGTGNLSDINLVLQNFFEKNWSYELRVAEQIGTSVTGNVLCPYFGRRFFFAPNSPGGLDEYDNANLRIESSLALLLLALAPPIAREDGPLNETLEPLRSLSSVGSQLKALTRIEFLIFQSVYRSIESPSEMDDQWMRTLALSDRELSGL